MVGGGLLVQLLPIVPDTLGVSAAENLEEENFGGALAFL